MSIPSSTRPGRERAGLAEQCGHVRAEPLADPLPGRHHRLQCARAAMERLVDGARAADVPVVFTAVRYEHGESDAPLFFRKAPALRVFAADSALGDFAPTLTPVPGELVVTKHYASAFFGTSLATWLRTRGVDTVVIAGFSTSGCVRASGVDALQHGFRPIVVREAVADRDVAPHEANLFDLDAKYADVMSLPDVLDRFDALPVD